MSNTGLVLFLLFFFFLYFPLWFVSQCYLTSLELLNILPFFLSYEMIYII